MCVCERIHSSMAIFYGVNIDACSHSPHSPVTVACKCREERGAREHAGYWTDHITTVSMQSTSSVVDSVFTVRQIGANVPEYTECCTLCLVYVLCVVDVRLSNEWNSYIVILVI